ncbi:MAG: hypothetical protein LBO05_01395 [Deltaproteobacteria bacterium]|jgi:phosphoribosylaminoimidazolecarboxamide formyltransferase/IMP cyclohydrolase|nr:hypothetical protein [Deltaproteobacteria bacterium]
MKTVKRALLSVSDKTGLVGLARFLAGRGVEIVSTGGTAAELVKNGLAVVEVSSYTGSPEMLDGRVKTLHPKVHAGILHRRSLPDHVAQMEARGWTGIDLVAVSLYPFESVVARPGTSFEEAVENIDIGGPCLLRASAKNHRDVVVLCDPGDYQGVMDELEKTGDVSRERRLELARKVYARTSEYDRAIADYLAKHA